MARPSDLPLPEALLRRLDAQLPRSLLAREERRGDVKACQCELPAVHRPDGLHQSHRHRCCCRASARYSPICGPTCPGTTNLDVATQSATLPVAWSKYFGSGSLLFFFSCSMSTSASSTSFTSSNQRPMSSSRWQHGRLLCAFIRHGH